MFYDFDHIKNNKRTNRGFTQNRQDYTSEEYWQGRSNTRSENQNTGPTISTTKRRRATKEKHLSGTDEIRQKIYQKARRAIMLNKDIQDKIKIYKFKGYDIENEHYAIKARFDINDILKAADRKNATIDQLNKYLDRMKDFASVKQYDNIKFNEVKYKDVRREEKQTTQKLNKILEQAQELYPENIKTNEYTPLLQALIMEVNDNQELAKPDETALYKVDEKYDPKKEEELFRNIEFKTMIATPETEAITEALEQKLHDEQVRVQLLKEDISNKSYNSNVKSINNLDVYTMYTLENVMNSSAAWHICKSYDDDSDQTKANWVELYKYTRLALDTDFELFDKVVTMIENEASLDNIINYIDHEIYDMM